MTTDQQREYAGVSLVSKPVLPTESKHELDGYYRNKYELALDKKALRRYNNEMNLFQKDLAKTVSDPRGQVAECFKLRQYKNISPQEAYHIPKAA